MILWINGAFGAGKSTTAEELARHLDKSFIYDPEQVGYFLWDNFPDEMRRKGDFQNMAIWRQFNYKILKHIAENYTGTVIVPMTIYVKQYYDEIIGCLENDGIAIRHFILTASREAIIDRVVKRGGDCDGWEAQHIDVCLDAFDNDIPGHKIDTEKMNIDEVASEIISLLGGGNT